MPTEPVKPRPPARKGRKRARGRLFGCLAASIIPLSILAVVGLLVLTVVSHRIAARFESREQEAPTRVYGRAVRLDGGTLLPANEIVERLKRLGYRAVKTEPKNPGEYRTGSTLAVHLRPFEAPGGEVPARSVTIHHSGKRISRVTDTRTGKAVKDVRLEPEILATLYGPVQEDRTVLPLSEFPVDLVEAVLVVEDKRFYSHLGIDPVGILRAALTNAGSGEIRQGGSTLTQQLAKNLFFDQDRTWSRKAAEAVTAVVLEVRFSKDRIVQAYLNEIYLGQKGAVSIKGFAQAAWFYFGKDVRALDLSESATLAGLIRAPGVYNPFTHPDRAVERRDQVLAAMETEGKITAEERRKAAARKLQVHKDNVSRASQRGISYLADYVRQMIGTDTVGDLSLAGLKVFTTVDPSLQRWAQDALTRGVTRLEDNYRRLRRREGLEKLQGAMVVLDPSDASVLAMVGGRDYATSQFNRITQAHRQPGSLFKPFVYLTGYEASETAGWGQDVFTPATQLVDEPLEMHVGGKLWAPANYDNEFRGPVTAQMALEQSLNVPTVRAAQEIGLKSIVSLAHDAGIVSTLKPFPSLALGAQEVTPLEIATAYATIANGGTRNTASMVEAIEDAQGTSLYKRVPDPKRTLSAGSTFLITVGLAGALDRGTGASSRALGFTGTAAGKTGTTDDYRDAWFTGYTPDLLALVWVGFDDGDSTGLTGAQAALPIWVDFMKHGVASTTEPFPEPEGIRWEEIDPVSGGLARWSCPDTRYLAFIEGTQPSEKCTLHGWFGSWWSRKEDEEPEREKEESTPNRR